MAAHSANALRSRRLRAWCLGCSFLACSVVVTVEASYSESRQPNCFVPVAEPSMPFDDESVQLMVRHFLANLDVNGTGAVIASPGAVPALVGMDVPGGYAWDWMRDGALSMAVLQRLATDASGNPAEAPRVSSGEVVRLMRSYASWVRRVQGQRGIDVHTEPKWDIGTARPYQGDWCRPQTDGPGLRAKALMDFARGLGSSDKDSLWPLIRFDLDWLATGGPGSYALYTCDLWEETMDSSFLWNHATMHTALIEGADFAKSVIGDPAASMRYSTAASRLGEPGVNHLESETYGGYLTACPMQGSSLSCRRYGKDIDGSVILSLVHSRVLSPSSYCAARTVSAYNAAFCTLYPVNQRDTAEHVPGVLYGRYQVDVYGGGNPWVLVTASLASLLYRAAQEVPTATLCADTLRAWQDALAWTAFAGSAEDFIAAGDSVMARLHHHIDADYRLYEQIDRRTGKQFNARDLTWSYAEVLNALHERRLALKALRPMLI